jgi:hypothetical protein
MLKSRTDEIASSPEQGISLGILAPLTNDTFRLPPIDAPKPLKAPRSTIRSPWVGHGGRDVQMR